MHESIDTADYRPMLDLVSITCQLLKVLIECQPSINQDVHRVLISCHSNVNHGSIEDIYRHLTEDAFRTDLTLFCNNYYSTQTLCRMLVYMIMSKVLKTNLYV